jgi:hypothetical protein
MNEVLLSAGVAAVILAIVGGGATAFGVEVPVIPSLRRQMVLGLAGVAFVAVAVGLREPENGGVVPSGRTATPVSTADVGDYRQEVLAACRALPRGEASPTDGTTYRRDSYISHFARQRRSFRSILKDLFDLPAPTSLANSKLAAQRAWTDIDRRWGVEIDRLETELPAQWDLFSPPAVFQVTNDELGPPAARLERAMSRLAGAPCTPSVGNGGG